MSRKRRVKTSRGGVSVKSNRKQPARDSFFGRGLTFPGLAAKIGSSYREERH